MRGTHGLSTKVLVHAAEAAHHVSSDDHQSLTYVYLDVAGKDGQE